MMEFSVTPAELSDARFIIEANRAMALETENKELDINVLQKGVQAVLTNPYHGEYWIAKKAGQPAGCLMITYEWSDWRNGQFWWIQSVYVMPEYRRQGVFRALFDHIQENAKADYNCCGLRLYVEKSNQRAQNTYASLGMAFTDYDLYELDFTK
jgi:ribosomal protein S18 acetylase RimI-like enzyme